MLFGTPREVRRKELIAPKLPGFSENLPAGAFSESEEFLLVFIALEKSEPVFALKCNSFLLRDEVIEKSFPRSIGQFVSADSSKEDLDQ